MSDFSVLFSASSPHNTPVPPDTVFIWPVETKWNDFGFNYLAKASIRIGEAQPFDLSLVVVPWPDEHDRFATWLQTQLADLQVQPSEPAPINGTFFSILNSEVHYRTLIQNCHQDRGLVGRILRPMRDLVYWRSHNLERETIVELLASERVNKGVFRREGAYLAWHRGPRILAGEPLNPVEDARADFAFRAELPGFGGAHELRVRFGVPAPLVDRCHALIGRNGAGKSLLLRELMMQMAQRMDGSDTSPFRNGELPASDEVEWQPGDFKVNRIVAMSWDSGSRFPPNTRLDSPCQYLSFRMVENVSDDVAADDAHIDASETQAALLLQMLRESGEPGKRPYDRLRAVLKPIFDARSVCVYLRPTPEHPQGRWVRISELQNAFETSKLETFARVDLSQSPKRFNHEHEPVPLSSGERVFLSFAIRGVARLIPGSLLVLDEPETHLHPNLISGFMRVLAQLLIQTNSIALAATHSPFVVRELPSRCVHVVRLEDEQRPTISSAFLRTLGASIDQLSIDIFGDADSEQLNKDLADQIISSGMTFEEIRTVYGRELSPDLLGEIRERMESPQPNADTDGGDDDGAGR